MSQDYSIAWIIWDRRI